MESTQTMTRSVFLQLSDVHMYKLSTIKRVQSSAKLALVYLAIVQKERRTYLNFSLLYKMQREHSFTKQFKRSLKLTSFNVTRASTILRIVAI